MRDSIPLLLLLSLAAPAAGQTLTYSGQLTSADGAPVEAWPHLRFTLHDAAGEPLWSTLVDRDVLVMTADEAGHFLAALAFGEYPDGREGLIEPTLAARADTLSVEVCDRLPCVDSVPLGPPQLLSSVPRAMHAETAAQVMPGAVAGAVYQLDDLVVAAEPGPGEHASLPEALAALEGRLLPPWRDITIHIGPGTFRHDGPVVIDRSDAQRLRIIGAGSAETTLAFPTSSGLEITAGRAVGEVDALTIAGQLGGARPDVGLTIEAGASLRLGDDVAVRDFEDRCVYVYAGHLVAHGLEVSNCGSYGVQARARATVLSNGASVSSAEYGFSAHEGSLIRCGSCVVTDVAVHGFLAASSSHVHARRARVDGAGSDDYRATLGGMVDADEAEPEGEAAGSDPAFVAR